MVLLTILMMLVGYCLCAMGRAEGTFLGDFYFMLHLSFSFLQNTKNSLRAVSDLLVLPHLRRFFSSGLTPTNRCLSFLNQFRRRQIGSFLYLSELDGSRINDARKFLDSCSFCPFPQSAFTCVEDNFQYLTSQWIVSSDDRVVLYFHGGGLFFSTVEKCFPHVLLSCLRARVFIPRYRLAPEHKFLAQYDDALMSYQYLLKQGISPSKIIVIGQSWGASLALSLLLNIEKRSLPHPSCAVLMSPFIPTSCDNLFLGSNERKGDWLLPDHVSSYMRLMGFPDSFDVDRSWSKLPPILIQIGQDDIFVSSMQDMFDRASHFSENLRLRTYPNMTHNFHHLYSLSTISEQAFSDMSGFVDVQCLL